MYEWVVFIHVMGAFGFMLAHGGSAAIAFRLKQEKDPERIRALLDLSGTSWIAFAVTFLVMFVAGIVLGFMGRWWRTGWIWTSLGILLAMSVYMAAATGRHYHALRKVVGLPYMEGSKEMPASEQGSPDEIQAAVDLGRPWLMAIIGVGSWALIVWLMMFKPF